MSVVGQDAERRNAEWAMEEDAGMRMLERWSDHKYVHGRLLRTRRIAAEIGVLLSKWRLLRLKVERVERHVQHVRALHPAEESEEWCRGYSDCLEHVAEALTLPGH